MISRQHLTITDVFKVQMPSSVPTAMPGVTDKLENQHATKSSAGGGSLSYLDAVCLKKVKEWMRIGTVCIGDTLSISLYQKPDVAGLNKWMDSD
ncbi:hypothetical protein D5086_017692 [Populus alba]|uniref:Uncharacterized protein n=2 Tax=Populus TaxID=3689 RepID=A0ACC4BNA4_POPAL|nr:hypothetical protein NC653_022585 [Populus alba x Populus x berolinensis]